MPKIDWLKIKKGYVEGNCSLEKIAEMFGITPSYVKAVASKENWQGQRQLFRQKLDQKQTEKTLEAQSKLLAKKNLERSKNWQEIQQKILTRFSLLDPETDKDFEIKAQKLVLAYKESVLGERLEDGQPITLTKEKIISEITEKVTGENNLAKLLKDAEPEKREQFIEALREIVRAGSKGDSLSE